MAEHDIEKIVEAGGEVFNFRDPTKQPVADRVTSIRAASSATDTNYPTEKAVRTELDKMAPGAITTDVTIANGDKMIISDASDSSKMKRASAAFDGSTTKNFLNQKGTFTRVLEADLEWGGDFRTSKSPSEAYTRQNLWFNPKSSAVYVEYCTDRTSANPTWLPYGETDTDKLKLFSGAEDTAAAFYCGKNTHIQPGYTGSISGAKDLTNEIVPDQGLRITICCRSFASRDADVDNWSYGQIVRVLMNVDTNSATGGTKHCLVETMTGANFKADNDTWVTRGDFNIAGNSGWNSIPLQVTFGGGWPQTSQVWVVRFTIWAEALSANPASGQTGNLKINTIAALTKTTWSNDAMKRFGTPYSITVTGGAVFKDIKFTARKLKTNLGRTADSTFDGSADQLNIPVTGTLPVGNGGTGKGSVTSGNYLVGNGTSALTEKNPKTVGNNVLAALDEGSSAFSTDNAVIITGDSDAANTTTFYRRKFSYIWTWIQSKISTVLGLSTTGYTGTADTAKAYDPTFSGTNSIASALESKVTEIAFTEGNASAATDLTNVVLCGLKYYGSSLSSGRLSFTLSVTIDRGSSSKGGILRVDLAIGSDGSIYCKRASLTARSGGLEISEFRLVTGTNGGKPVVGVVWNGTTTSGAYMDVRVIDYMALSASASFVYDAVLSNVSNVVWGSGNAIQSASDSDVVHISGSETITGAKEFSRSGQETNFTDSSGSESIVRARTSTSSNNGSCQLNADRTTHRFGVYGRNENGTGKWVSFVGDDGVVNLGSNGDGVRIGGTKFVFNASQLGTEADTFYWI